MTDTTTTQSRRALITGVTGQDGSYLAELLLDKGYEVWGMVRRTSSNNIGRISHLCHDACHEPNHDSKHNENRFHLCHGDLSDGSSLSKILAEVRPHEVYNLGAQSHVRVSFEMPEYTADVTGVGVVRMLEALRELKIDARFFQASSSELYGLTQQTPQTETTPFYPRNPYAAAKALGFHITRNYRESYNMFAVNGILFNHESPRRGETFVTRKISRAAARISLDKQQTLRLGNLAAVRDWGFAGDYVKAMWLIMQADQPDDFVIATGENHSVREFCEICFAHVDLPLTWEGEGLEEKGRDSQGNVRVEVDPQYFRPAEVDTLLGDASKARRVLGWQPEMTFVELAKTMVAADLELAQKEC